METVKRKRCANGSRWSKKTLKCEKNEMKKVVNKSHSKKKMELIHISYNIVNLDAKKITVQFIVENKSKKSKTIDFSKVPDDTFNNFVEDLYNYKNEELILPSSPPIKYNPALHIFTINNIALHVDNDTIIHEWMSDVYCELLDKLI